jgi:hypothetical protein
LSYFVYTLLDGTGIDKLAAIVLLAELGNISRFDSPKQLMAFLGLVPSEHSSGGRRRQGAITLTGNTHARRMLVKSAWSYHFPARQTKHLKAKASNASPAAQQIAWKAQVRLCGRYRTLTRAGKDPKLVCVAIARELAGFALAHKLLKTVFVLIDRGDYYRDASVDYATMSVERNAPRWIKMLRRYRYIPA